MSCHDHSCEKEKGGAHHGHHHESACSGFDCPCSCHSCTCEEVHSADCCDKSHQLLALANIAWMEVLKEKIKEHIRSTDTKIDEIARIVSETNREYWHGKMAEAKAKEQYERRLSELFEHTNFNQAGSSPREKGKQKKGF